MASPAPQSGTAKAVESLRRHRMTGKRVAVGLAALIYLRWLDFQDAEQEAIAAFEGRTYRALLPDAARWRHWSNKKPGITAGSFFQSELPDALNNCFPAGSPLRWALAEGLKAFDDDPEVHSSQGEWSVEIAVKWLKSQPFETPRERRRLLAAYDEILAGSEDPSGPTYRTPPELARLVAGLAAPQPGERVYDPCFGTARLLTAAVEILRDRGAGHRHAAGDRALVVTGAELAADTFLIGMARLVLAGVESPLLVLGNSLERLAPDPSMEGADLAVADPPIGERVEPQGLGHLPVPTKDATSLFVQHVIQQLGPRGRAVVLVPQGFLFKRGPEARVREYLTRNHAIDRVIGLPPGIYVRGSAVRVAILVLRKDLGGGRTRMVDGESLWRAARRMDTEGLGAELIESILDEAHGESDSQHAWTVDTAEMAAADWDLTPRRRDLSALERTLEELPAGAQRSVLGELAEVLSGTSSAAAAIARERSERHAIPYLRIGDVQKGALVPPNAWIDREGVAGRYRLRAGDILLSKSGTIGKVAVVAEGGVGAVAASGFYVLRPVRERIDSRYLAAYLQCGSARAWLKNRATGATIAHLSVGAIRDLPVPVPAIPVQERVARSFAARGEDALTLLRRILEVESDDLDTPAVRDWLVRLLDGMPDLPGDDASPAAPIAALTGWLDNRSPIRRCGICRKPYSILDVSRSPEYAGSPHDYSKGCGTTCLSCWLGLEPDDSGPDAPAGGLIDWAVAFDDALRPLAGIASVPPGPALLALIQDGRRRLDNVRTLLDNGAAHERSALLVTQHTDHLLSCAERGLLSAVSLRFEPERDYDVAGVGEELVIAVANRSLLPLRDVRVWAELSPLQGGGAIAYLAEFGRKRVTLKNCVLTASADEVAVDIRWTAVTLDGQEVRGAERLVFKVVAPGREAEKAVDLGSSPYVCGVPVDLTRNDVFFGREQELEQIRRQVASSGNVILLEGNRRAGKTSLLKRLEGRDAVPGWLGVFCSFQGASGSEHKTGVPTVEVFRLIAKELAAATHRLGLDTPLPDGSILTADRGRVGIAKACRAGIVTEGAFSDFEEYLGVLLELVDREGLGILLLLDEFDKLQEGIDNGVTSPQVPENVRFLVQNNPRFSAVLTGSRRLKRLREEYWSALFGLGTRIGVSALPEEAARRLIKEPVAGRLVYSDPAVARVIELTAAQPFLVQNLCNRIFDLLARELSDSRAELKDVGSGRSFSKKELATIGVAAVAAAAVPLALPAIATFLSPELRRKIVNAFVHGRSLVTPDIVDLAAKELVQDNEHFAALWSYAGSHRRRFILALCRREEGARGSIRFAELSELLAAEGVPIPDEVLDSDLDHLRELELLDLAGKGEYGRYRLAVPLMGLWIDNQQDFDGLRVKARYETEDEHG